MRQQTLVKIIRLMRRYLEKGITILEISKRLNIGYRPAHNHITAMEQEGIIQVEKVGNAKQCRLELGSEKTRHLLVEVDMEEKKEICDKNPKIKAIVESIITKITEKHITEIQAVILFGSYAKKTATKTSDIDLLFIINDLKGKEIRGSIERLCASFQHSHNITVSPIITDIGEFKTMLQGKEINVGKEAREYGISLYGSEIFWRLLA